MQTKNLLRARHALLYACLLSSTTEPTWPKFRGFRRTRGSRGFILYPDISFSTSIDATGPVFPLLAGLIPASAVLFCLPNPSLRACLQKYMVRAST